MYLKSLKSEKKNCFLDLCIHASNVDGVFAEEEKRYIQDYCVEMQLDAVCYSAKKNLEDAISKIIEVRIPIDLKIIFFEIMGLVLAYREFEKKRTRVYW